MKRGGWLIAGATFLAACSGTSTPASPSVKPAMGALVPSITQSSTMCDDRLWAPVYSKDRLAVLSPCEVETGIVKFVELERDGDLTIHMLPDTDRFLGPGNVYLDASSPARPDGSAACGVRGCLQVEIPCQGSISQADAMNACGHFTGKVLTSAEVPHVGDRIRAAAHLVEDKRHHNWHELHGAVVTILRAGAPSPGIGAVTP